MPETSSTTVQTPTGRFARRSTRGVLLGFSGWRCVAIGVGTAGLLAGLLAGSILLGIVLLAPFAMVAFVRVSGTYTVEWTPVVTHWLWRRAARQTGFRARPDRPRPAGTLALPGDAAALRLYVGPDDQVCAIHDPHRGTLSAVVTVTHPAYVLLSPDAQRQRVLMWGRALASLSQSTAVAGLQILEATIPDSGRGTAEYYARQGADQGGWAEEQYEQLLGTTALGASTHRTTLTLTLDTQRAGAAVKAAGGGLRGAARALRDDMAALEYALRAADLRIGSWLGERELAQIIRTAYDPGRAAFGSDSPAADLGHAGPLGLDEMWDRLHHDTGWSRVLWISEWPRIEVPAHFLHSLIFAPGIRKTLCVSVRPKDTVTALREIQRQKSQAISDSEQKRKIGQIERLSDRQEFEDIQQREEALVNGHADVDFTGWVVISAPDEGELDAATKRLERAAGQAGCEVRVLFGRQAQAFVAAALPIGRHTL